jgi:hypothetical protein
MRATHGFHPRLDEVFPVKAENSRIGGAALAEEGSHRVTEDNEPLARGDHYPLSAMTANLVDIADVIAEFDNPFRPFLSDGRRAFAPFLT